jgi:DNA repair and recombination protein RAD52
MENALEAIRSELNAKIPRDAIAQREGVGRKLSYLEGWYVINRLNEIFGQGNWAYETEEMRLVHTGEVEGRSGSSHVAHYVAKVKLRVRLADGKGVEFSDFGYGDGSDKQNPGKAHELAGKEAVTDGIKRCAKNLGMSMGLALYDKTQENVDDGEDTDSRPAPKSAPAPAAAQGPKPSKPETKAPPVAKRVDTGNAPGAIPAEAPEDRGKLNDMISAMANTLNSRKLTTFAEIKARIKELCGSDKKEALSDEQARELYTLMHTRLFAKGE